jgi:hypothetical protein
METSLHRDLKKLYAGDDAQVEVRLGAYRIDAVLGSQLVEIQHGSLAAIRDKVRKLLDEHDVLIVKPIVARKTIIKHHTQGGRVASRRLSPKRGTLVDLFDELVYFTRVFPHPRLTIEVVLVEVEESRYPGHGRRRRWRKTDHVVEDQRLVSVGASCRLQTAADLVKLLSVELPASFHTGQLAEALGVRRWIAQRIAYCLRESKAIEPCGKQGNAWLYKTVKAKKPKRGKGRAA